MIFCGRRLRLLTRPHRSHPLASAEILAIYRVLHRLGQSISLIAQEPELKGRGNAAINTKMRSEFKVSRQRDQA